MPISPYVRDLRAHLGTRRLLMPSVAGIVRDPENRVLLVRQQESGVWSTPGGVIEMEDSPADAVVREVWEETGLVVRPNRIIGVYGGPNFVVVYPNGDETQYIAIIFECSIESGTLRADGDETIAAQFWTKDDTSRLRLAPWLVRVLPRLFEASTEAWFERAVWRPTPTAP